MRFLVPGLLHIPSVISYIHVVDYSSTLAIGRQYVYWLRSCIESFGFSHENLVINNCLLHCQLMLLTTFSCAHNNLSVCWHSMCTVVNSVSFTIYSWSCVLISIIQLTSRNWLSHGLKPDCAFLTLRILFSKARFYFVLVHINEIHKFAFLKLHDHYFIFLALLWTIE